MGIKIKSAYCLNCKNIFEYNSFVSFGKYCSNKCQMKYQRTQKINDGTAGWQMLKTYLKENSDGSCSMCGVKEWLNKPIMLITDHIDGDSLNNNLRNLRLICSNCDATLPTYKSKNRGNGRASRRDRYSVGKSY